MMEVEKITIHSKQRKETPYIIKARELMIKRKEEQSRLKNGDLYDLNALADKLGLTDPDYDWKQLQIEIQQYKDHQTMQRQKYWTSGEGQSRLAEMKKYEPIKEVNGFGELKG